MYFKFTFHGHIILSCLFIESQEFVPITFSNSKFQNKYSLCADHQNSPYYKLSDSSILSIVFVSEVPLNELTS